MKLIGVKYIEVNQRVQRKIKRDGWKSAKRKMLTQIVHRL